MKWSLETMSSIMLKVARFALQKRNSMKILVKNTDISNTNEIYTNIDMEIETMLTEYLLSGEDNIFILGEETASEVTKHMASNTMLSHTTWVIDPIDGTRNFANGLPLWGISIGYVENFEFKEGAVIFPDLYELLISNNGKTYQYKSHVSFLNIDTIDIHDFTEVQDIPISHNYKIWAASNTRQIQSTPTHHASHLVRSCVYAISKVLTNNYFAYIGKAKIWDFAACIALFRYSTKKIFYYNEKTDTLHNFPFNISEECWDKKLIHAKYPLVFCTDKSAGKSIIPTGIKK